MKEDPASQSWHLDKRIPIALIVTLAVQTGLGIWWAADLSARVGQVERTQTASAPHSERLTRVETRLEAVQSGIERIERAIQQTQRAN